MGLNFPNTPIEGQIFAPPGAPQYTFRANAWRSEGKQDLITSTTPPLDPKPGQLWWNSANGNTYVWYVDADSGQWVQINMGSAPIYADTAFATRGDLVANVASGMLFDAGQALVAEGYAYVGAPGATVIPDLPGLLPLGASFPQHFGAVAGDVTTDITYLQTLINASNGKVIQVAEGDLIADTLLFDTGVAYTPFVKPVNLINPDLLTWGAQFLTVTPGAMVGPDGLNTAFRLTDTDDAGVLHIHQIFVPITVVAGKTYTFSYYASLAYNTSGAMLPRNPSSVFPTSLFGTGSSVFDPTGDGAILSGTGVIDEYGGEWYLCSLTATAIASGTDNLFIRPRSGTTQSYAGTGIHGVFIDKVVFEEAATPSKSFDDNYAGPVTELAIRGTNKWTSKIRSDNELMRALSINKAGRLVLENLEFTNDKTPDTYVDGFLGHLSSTSETRPSHDVTVRNCYIHDVLNPAFEVRYGLRWRVEGCTISGTAREAWACSSPTRGHIFVNNHISNVGDDVIAFSGDHSIYAGNNYDGRGLNHPYLTGGGMFKCRGSHNVMDGNTFDNVNSWFIHYWNSDISAEATWTRPTGNICSDNVCKSKGSIRWSHRFVHYYGLYTLVSIDGGINHHRGNHVEGVPWIDAILWKESPDEVDPDTGGTYTWDGDTIVGMNSAVYIRDTAKGGKQLLIKNTRFLGINSVDMFLADALGSARTWEEIVFQDCEFLWATGVIARYLVNLPTGCNITIGRLVFKGCRVSGPGTIQAVTSLGSGSVIGQLIDTDNYWTVVP